jgi:hypothetical protein
LDFSNFFFFFFFFFCPPLFIAVPLPIHESELSRIWVLGLSILPLSASFLLDFGHVSTVIYISFYYETCNLFEGRSPKISMIRTSYYLLFWMNFVADLLWLFRSFYVRRSSVSSYVERDFVIRILFRFCIG